jgi:acyl-coenzyme A thioesterase PaaI-like protein
VSAARGEDLTARASVIRRGESLCFCEVEVTGEAGQVVAKGLVTHRFA